eukprot:4705834-Prymnesium_polylepis.1
MALVRDCVMREGQAQVQAQVHVHVPGTCTGTSARRQYRPFYKWAAVPNGFVWGSPGSCVPVCACVCLCVPVRVLPRPLRCWCEVKRRLESGERTHPVVERVHLESLRARPARTERALLLRGRRWAAVDP